MKEDSRRRFSLVENGILERTSAKVLLINVGLAYFSPDYGNISYANNSQGMLDDVFPIEDSILALQHGSVKEARFVPGLKHLGEPVAGPIIFGWIGKIFS